MAQTVLGLDIGTYSIKAALFDTTFRSFELTDLFESPPLQMDEVDPVDRPAILIEAINRLLKENRLSPSTVVTSLSGLVVSSRVLTLPLAERQVAKVLPFELESYIPFDLEEVIVDHHSIRSDRDQTICLAVSVQKELVAQHIHLLAEVGLQPAFVGIDSASLYNLNQQALKEEGGTYALIDLGHQKTSICIVSDHTLQYVRTLFTAGSSLTDVIRQQLDLTLEQAIEVKQTHGIIGLDKRPLTSPDLKKLSTAVKTGIDPLIREILQTFHAYRSLFSDKTKEDASPQVEQIYLSGGTSLLRNLPEYVEELTNIPTSRLRLFPQNSPSAKTVEAREPVLAQAVGLGLRAAVRGAAAKRVSSINFRKEGFALAQDLSGLKAKALFFGKWATLIFVLALFQAGFRYQMLSRDNDKIETKIIQEIKKVVPEPKRVPKKPKTALKHLQNQVRTYRDKQEVLTAGLNEMTALGVFREISTRIPETIPIDVGELTIDRNKITLRATVGSVEAVDQVITALKKHPEFHQIDRGDIRQAPNGKKAFQLSVTIGNKEDGKDQRRRRKRR